jgi:hypothetical protein
MNGMPKLCLVLCLGFATMGCGRDATVEEGQSREAFESDVEAKLKDFEKRIAAVRQQIDKLSAAGADAATTAVEMAEEQIETLRKDTLVRLNEAAAEESNDLKMRINDALASVDEYVSKAQDAVQRTLPDKDRYARDARERLEKLRARRNALDDRVEALGEDVQTRLELPLETAEEAIQEAHSSVGRYLDAAKEQAGAIRDNIESLIDQAEDQLEKIENTLEEQ